MSDRTIFIPSYNRDRLVSLDNLRGTSVIDQVVLVVHPDEVERYEKHGVEILPCPVQGDLGTVRRWLMDTYEGRFQVQMDDDLRFAVRREDDPSKFRIAMPEDVDVMFERVFELLEEVPLVGVRQRGGANRSTPPMELAIRQCMLHGIDVEVARKEGWAYKPCVFEDFDYTLQVLTSGYQNAVLTTHTIDQGESNAPGGVAVYRDNDRMRRDALELALDFPGFVRVIEKPGWRGMETRTDVNVQWKRALASAKEQKTNLEVSRYVDRWSVL